MLSKAPRALLDIAAFLGVAWMWLAVYESFTQSGLWRIIDTALGGANTLPAQAAVLASCVLAGWLAIEAAAWLVWRTVLVTRLAPQFPRARIHSSSLGRLGR